MLIEQVEALGQLLEHTARQEEVQPIMELHLGQELTDLALLEQQHLEPLHIETLEIAPVTEEAIAQEEVAVLLEVATTEALVVALEAAVA
mgnify:FL=1